MGLVERTGVGGEGNSPVPEVLVLVVLLDTTSDAISLADVDAGKLVIFGPIPNQDVDSGTLELLPALDLGPQVSGKDDPDTGPVHLVDEPNALGIAVNDEDSDGVAGSVHDASMN